MTAIAHPVRLAEGVIGVGLIVAPALLLSAPTHRVWGVGAAVTLVVAVAVLFNRKPFGGRVALTPLELPLRRRLVYAAGFCGGGASFVALALALVSQAGSHLAPIAGAGLAAASFFALTPPWVRRVRTWLCVPVGAAVVALPTTSAAVTSATPTSPATWTVFATALAASSLLCVGWEALPGVRPGRAQVYAVCLVVLALGVVLSCGLAGRQWPEAVASWPLLSSASAVMAAWLLVSFAATNAAAVSRFVLASSLPLEGHRSAVTSQRVLAVATFVTLICVGAVAHHVGRWPVLLFIPGLATAWLYVSDALRPARSRH